MPAKVLVIDDDLPYRKLLELKLKGFMQEMQLTHFDTLEKARNFLSTNKGTRFDLVVLDEHLPDGRGNEFLNEGWFESTAVLSMSSDTAPEIPGATLQAGAAYFINKRAVSEPLFEPLVRGIMDRNRVQQELNESRLHAAVMESVKTLLDTLRHEINNPLGAVLGAAYLLRSKHIPEKDHREAVELVETSGKRIKHVIEQLCKTVSLDSLEPVTKANQKVYHIAGDKPWDDGKEK